MKKSSYILGGLVVGILLSSTLVAHAQVTANYWKLLSNVLQPNVASWHVAIPFLPNQNCVGTDANGVFQAGTCGGSGGSFPFTPAIDYGVNTSATTTALWGQAGIFASSSSAYPTFSAGQAGSGPVATFIGGNVGISSTSPTSALTVGVAGTSAIPAIAVGTTGNQGLYQAGTNSLGFEAGGGGFQWNGTAVTPNSVNKTLGTTANPWSKLQFGAPTGGWYIGTSTLTPGGAWLSNGGYPQLLIGADDASPVSDVELNSVNQGNYGSYGVKINNGGSTYTGVWGMDITDTIAGIPDYLFIDNQTGSATCLQIKDNGATCLSDYNTLSSLLDTISPAYNVAGTESGMTTTLQQASGNDAVDYGLQNYPGANPTGIDAYQNYYSNVYAQPLPEPHFSFWEQANGNSSESATAWSFLGATTTIAGPNATTTSIDVGDVGSTTPQFDTLMNPGNPTFNVLSSSTKAVAFTVSELTRMATTTDFQVLNTGTASSTNYVDSSLTSGNCVQASTGGLLTTTTGACGSGSSTGLSTTSPIASSNLLEYSSVGAGSAFGVATSTLTASSPLTGSFTQIGSGGTLGCQTASGSQAGCLSSTDWNTFNNKQGGGFQISTTSPISISNLAYFTGVTPTSLGGIATTTLTGTGLISVSNAPVVLGATPSVASLTGGTNGQYLVTLNGVPTWQATTTVSNGTGINCSFNAGANAMSCSFANISTNTVLTNQSSGNGVPLGEATSTFSHNLYGNVAQTGFLNTDALGLGTTTPFFLLSLASSTASQLSLSDAISTDAPFDFRSVANTLYISTSSPTTFATTTPAIWSLNSLTGSTTEQHLDLLSTATNTFAGGVNLTSGCYSINNVCVGGGGSGLTSVGISLPTGFTVANSPLTSNGTISATLNTGFSVKELPSYTVCASGCDFTTLQAALNAAGTAGGGTIVPTDPTYAIGSTGLVFKGSNTTIQCRTATTTISFTGATNAFSTNSSAGQYSQDGVVGCTVTGDGNTAGVAFELSDMSHFDLENNTVNNVGSFVEASDTQNITFYDRIVHNNATTLTKFGINASSTNPVNAWYVSDNFIGCSTASCIGVQLTNSNGNSFSDNYIESASANNTKDIVIFDNAIATCNGVFNNIFTNNYLEGAKTTGGTQGVSIATNLCPNGGIQRNEFINNTNENHALDWAFPSATSTIISLQSFDNNYNSNFGNPLTSFEGPFGISTSSELGNISATAPAWTFFGINPTAGVATNDFTIGSSSATLLNVNNAGQLQVNNGGQINQVTSGAAIPLQVEANSSGVPIALSVFDSGFANTSDLVKLNQVNGSDSGPVLHLLDAGTGPALYVQTGNSGFGTSTPQWEIDAANLTKPQLSLTDGTLTSNPWDFRSISGAFYLSTSSLTTFATSSNALFSIIPSATANATTTFSLTDWVLKQTSQTALLIQDAFGTNDVAINTASTTGSIFTVAATTSPSIFSPTKLFDVDQYGHQTASSSLAEPTLGTCTGGATFDTNSNDVTGGVTLTTAVTSCAVVFASAYAQTPEVFLTGAGTVSFPAVTARSTTGFTIGVGAAVTGDHISYYVLQP